MRDVVIAGYARTPVGRFGGGLAGLSAMELGGRAIAAALRRGGAPAAAVDYVVMGHVLQAGQGQITARQAAVAGGVSMDVAAETVNKVCLSGMTAVSRARDLIRLGEFDLVVAGGMESMSRAGHVTEAVRSGVRLGDATLTDVMLHDGLTCAFDACAMGLATEQYQHDHELGITRAEQDEIAARSHERAAAAAKNGVFDDVVVPVEVPQRRGEPVSVTRDEGVRAETTPESLAGLRPAFSADGTITAGNASQISDGAAALVLTTPQKAAELGLDVLAEVTSWGTVAGPDPSLHLQPANAVRRVSERLGTDPASFDVYEINEAFAAVVAASVRALGVDHERVNVNGGAISLGHPIGASGARIVIEAVNALRHRGGGAGVAALCGGGGQGEALTLRVA